MMEKRYQVFVSSTYADLKTERQQVMQALMEMDCIPAGMELFPALDEEQFNFIKRVIDDCDYYILIIGGRYGSLTAEGISYTEQEFDYAVAKGMKVIALLHSDPNSLMVSQTDADPALTKQLALFRQKAQTGRLVRFWKNSEELPGLVALSLTKTIKTYPATGWVRATAAASPELLAQINELRIENNELRLNTSKNEAPKFDLSNLADMSDSIKVSGTSKTETFGTPYPWSAQLTWTEIFATISPFLLSIPTEGEVHAALGRDIFKTLGQSGEYISISDQVFQTIKIQLMALGLVELKAIAPAAPVRWNLTTVGERKMMELRVVRKPAAEG